MGKFGSVNFIRNALITAYILLVLSISATARAQMTINPVFSDVESIETEVFVGEVAMTPNQDFYLITDKEEVYQLESNIDLFDYNGQAVEVNAYKIKRKIGPVTNDNSLDPLPGVSKRAAAVPVLVIFGISGAATE